MSEVTLVAGDPTPDELQYLELRLSRDCDGRYSIGVGLAMRRPL
jgi:hypothetical protein